MQEQELKGAMVQKKVVLNKLRNERDDLQEELAAMEQESSRIESQIRAYQQVNGGRVTPYKGHFMLPVNGRFSSGFGVRVHPISHVRKMHTGQDIAAPSGTSIRAAGPGVVISTGWRGGYGNTVIIDHGGGISTLYGHCSKIYAHSGQKVNAGDSIAAVGTTGYSTGPHLHFEVRVNGTPVNPRKYL
jgi:murein DD-endopeptidase MepM/ murein hydrolase activator NlpD